MVRPLVANTRPTCAPRAKPAATPQHHCAEDEEEDVGAAPRVATGAPLLALDTCGATKARPPTVATSAAAATTVERDITDYSLTAR
mmetsp:Transcript_55460/g.129853  ORF Transcript_55460/g.129853 Transcript_55460/m.129853 type:complete len:86 (-) Transcript_55460:31-288(-)